LTRELVNKNLELESEVKRRQEAEQKATEANEAKSRFLSFISHEMRSPLNAIIGLSEELAETLLGDALPQSREDVTRIRSASQHLLGLINNLLDLSKIEAGKMPLVLDECELGPLVQELGRDLEPLVRRNGNKLTVHSNGDAPRVRTDVTKLKQVLMNLISNAGKFTSNGEIVVRIGDPGGTAEKRFEIAVTDSGIGMTGQEMSRLFQAYTQATDSTSRKYGGTGLGLAISRQFCRLMGGDLTVTSVVGKGSTFTVNLPAQVVATAE
jgi:signal transduction histidine kinase